MHSLLCWQKIPIEIVLGKGRLGICKWNTVQCLFFVVHLGRKVAITQITPLHCKDCSWQAKYQLLRLGSHQENGGCGRPISLKESKKGKVRWGRVTRGTNWKRAASVTSAGVSHSREGMERMLDISLQTLLIYDIYFEILLIQIVCYIIYYKHNKDPLHHKLPYTNWQQGRGRNDFKCDSEYWQLLTANYGWLLNTSW